jgi:hypothetical protein
MRKRKNEYCYAFGFIEKKEKCFLDHLVEKRKLLWQQSLTSAQPLLSRQRQDHSFDRPVWKDWWLALKA